MESISLSAARADLKAVMDRVVADRVPVAITRPWRGRGDGIGQRMGVDRGDAVPAAIAENAERLLESITRLKSGGGEVHQLIRS